MDIKRMEEEWTNLTNGTNKLWSIRDHRNEPLGSVKCC
jgi:hypothetical protein